MVWALPSLHSPYYFDDLGLTLRKQIEYVKTTSPRNSLEVQWLGLSAFTAGAQVQSLVRELRSHKLPNTAKRKKKKPTSPIT